MGTAKQGAQPARTLLARAACLDRMGNLEAPDTWALTVDGPHGNCGKHGSQEEDRGVC